MKVFSITLAILVLGTLVTRSEASILGDMLTFNGVVDLANDNSEGVFVDTTGPLGVPDGVPDLVQGVVWIDSVNGVNVATKTGGSIFAAFSFTITPTGSPGQFSAVATTGANSVESMLKKGGVGGADFSSLMTYNAAITTPAIAIIETPGSFTHLDWANTAAAGSPISLDFMPSAIVGDFSSFMVDMTAGFDGIDDSHIIDIFAPGVPIGAFAGIYSIAEEIFGVKYLPITSAAVPALGFPGGTGDIVIEDGSINSAAVNGSAVNGFNYSDKGTYALNPLPEPVSLLVWAGIAGLIAIRRTRAVV